MKRTRRRNRKRRVVKEEKREAGEDFERTRT